MSSIDWTQVEVLLQDVLQLDPARRLAFLDGIHDTAIRKEV